MESDMARQRITLKMRVFAALKHAGVEARLDVAEHLLRALEVLDGKDDRPYRWLSSCEHTQH